MTVQQRQLHCVMGKRIERRITDRQTARQTERKMKNERMKLKKKVKRRKKEIYVSKRNKGGLKKESVREEKKER